MLKQYEENFAEMSTKEKRDFLMRFGCLSISDDYINDLFVLMAYTRGLNTLKRVLHKKQPEILQIANGLLWDALAAGKTTVTNELAAFQECYQAAVCMIVNLDDSYIDTPEKEAFYKKYFTDWDYDNGFLELHSHLFYDIVTENGESPDRIGELLEHPVGTYVEDAFTDLKDDKPGYTTSELDRREAIVRDTPEFCNVIARLQQDMRAAVSDAPVEQLREQYRSLCLFSEEELERIARP